ncbi:unnamed protein product [Mytilus coruscus]|uniref:Uncharacterized protein n=1 Tax=Mytilus coruscus TaxID=42192 RepID=A0A6J8EB21_MYTCO|nr:unnamed protein product [Mytilus coruscus]
MESSKLLLKVTVIIHFILTVWATTSSFLPDSYIYMNLFVLLIGIFSIVHNESSDAVFMFFVLHCFTIVQDMIFLGIYQPIADETVEVPTQPDSVKNRYRFSLGMCITNLIIKPVTAFLLYTVWQERQGNPINLPFSIPGFGDGNNYRPYHDIDRSAEGYVETASTPRVMEDSRLTS